MKGNTNSNSIIIDSNPTQSSTNAVQSGGVYTALGSKANLSIVAPTYSSSSTYAVGDVVIYEGGLYQCNTAIGTAEDFDATHWTATTVDELIGSGSGGSDPTKADLVDLAPAYDSTATYAVGAIVTYNGDVYKCTTAVSSAEAFDSLKWTQKDVAELISESTPNLSNYVDLSSAQTITGVKTFNADIKMQNGGIIRNASYNAYIILNGSGYIDLASETRVRGLLRPNNNNTHDLGTSSIKWKDLYLSGNLSDGTNSVSVANIQPKATIDTTSTSPITLTNNKSFRLGSISALTINAASSYDLDFECEVVFTASANISGTYPSGITWSGDDIGTNGVEPVSGKTYNILFFNNATSSSTPNLQAIVRGV